MDAKLIFSGNLVFWLLIILLIATGILLCFFGYKYFRLISLGAICGVICFGGYHVAVRLTGNPIICLILCVSISSLGICMTYFVATVLTFLLDKTVVRQFMADKAYLVSAFLGAMVLALTFYFGIYRSLIAAVLIGLVCGGSGLKVQNKNKEKQVRFRTYEDLLKLKPLDGGEKSG